jgi:hypothetical protein
MLRLADVYLIYAEAVLGTQESTTDTKALEYLNDVRARAGLAKKISLTFSDILHERRIEFCLESQHWFDIKRFYYRNPDGAIAYLNAGHRNYVYDPIEGADANQWSSYKLNTTAIDPVVATAGDMYLPVPSEEVVSNPLLAPDVPAEEYVFGD